MSLPIISLGAGVQSTTVSLMAARGLLKPTPLCAIFADTGWEPAAVYKHLDWLEMQLPFPVHRVSAGNIREDIVRRNTVGKGRFAAVPWFTSNGGMGRRQCTKEYKLAPIRRKARELLGGKTPAGGIEMWIGISTDEAGRMKPSTVRYIKNRWPLIEADMSRQACLRWLERAGFQAPPKSSCIGCPYHADHQWRALTKAEFADAVEVDRVIRNGGTSRGMRHQQYMHRSLKPLDQVDLSTAEERGQLNMFQNECEGMCGV